jgi:polyisoprenoid-binding protein YceI
MIATSELSSANRLRDHHLRSGDFFDVARHPEVSFDVSEIVVDGRAVRLQGELLIRGRRHAFACSATAIRLSQDRIALEAGATLDLDELGMSRGLLHMLRASVTADVRVVLQRVVS